MHNAVRTRVIILRGTTFIYSCSAGTSTHFFSPAEVLFAVSFFFLYFSIRLSFALVKPFIQSFQNFTNPTKNGTLS